MSVGIDARRALPARLDAEWTSRIWSSRESCHWCALASGQNKIEVRFWDHWNKSGMPLSTVDYLNGDYTLIIRMVRAP